MTYLPIGYLTALGEARSCLADSTDDIDFSVHFGCQLIQLGFITGDVGPASFPMAGTRTELLGRLVTCGVDCLSIELLLADAIAGPSTPGGVSSCRVGTTGHAARRSFLRV